MYIAYDYYRIFYYVAKYGNVTQAARVLLNNQPNLTRAVKTLESESALPIGIKKYDFIELRFQMMREILRFNIRGIFLLVIVRCFLGTNKRIYAK